MRINLGTIGKLGDEATLRKIMELSKENPKLLDQYVSLLKPLENDPNIKALLELIPKKAALKVNFEICDEQKVVSKMKWEEIRSTYPNQWLKLKVLERHVEGDKEYFDDMEVIRTIESDIEATRELGRCKENEAVYHTYHNEIYFKIKNIFGYRKLR